MTRLEELYDHAENAGIDVDWVMMNHCDAFSMQLDDGDCVIGINPCQISSSADEYVKLAHEIGHCETGSFYNRYSPLDVVARHEVRADRWAIKKLVPKDKLDAAVADGRTEIWELAEYFNVTYFFMQKAVNFYQNL